MAKKNKKNKNAEQEPEKKECIQKNLNAPDISVESLFANYRAINDVLTDAFRTATRVNLETAWGKYMVFMTKRDDREFYFVHSGCTCDLKCMPKNMEYFQNMHELLKFIVNGSVFDLLKRQPKPVCCLSKCARKLCQLHNQKKFPPSK